MALGLTGVGRGDRCPSQKPHSMGGSLPGAMPVLGGEGLAAIK